MNAPDYRNDAAFDVPPPGSGIGRAVLTHTLCLLLGASLMYLWLTSLKAPRPAKTAAVAPTSKPTAKPPRAAAPIPAEAAPAAKPFSLSFEDDVRARGDGLVFIHAGCGSLTVTPRQNGEALFSHGYRGIAGSEVDLKRFRLLARLTGDSKLQQAVGLSDEQVTKLRRSMVVPIAAEDRRAVRELYLAYAAANEGPTKEAAKTQLLAAVRAAGDRQGPLVVKWLESQTAILTPEQFQALLATEAD